MKKTELKDTLILVPKKKERKEKRNHAYFFKIHIFHELVKYPCIVHLCYFYLTVA